MDWAAGVIGISPAIVRAQINMESGGQDVNSSAGAEGYAQFLPSTWRGLGCPGSPHNVNDAMRCYAKFMYQLVQQFHGNVRDALAAYNAGPGNLRAGYGYADSILAAAGQSQNTRASGGSGTAVDATLTANKQQAQAADVKASTDPSCAWGVHGDIPVLSKIPIVGGKFTADVCFLHKTTIRHAVGGLLVGAGFLVMLPGLAITVAFGFRASGAARVATQVISVVPGAGRVSRGTQAAGGTVSRATPAQRSSIPRGRIVRRSNRPIKSTQPRRPEEIEGTLPS